MMYLADSLLGLVLWKVMSRTNIPIVTIWMAALLALSILEV